MGYTMCLSTTKKYSTDRQTDTPTVDSSTAGPGRHHGRPGKWENRGLLGSSLDRVLDNDASLMLTTVWKRGKPAKMAVRAQENRACGAKKRRASRATRGLKRRPCGRPHTPVGESSARRGCRVTQPDSCGWSKSVPLCPFHQGCSGACLWPLWASKQRKTRTMYGCTIFRGIPARGGGQRQAKGYVGSQKAFICF